MFNVFPTILVSDYIFNVNFNRWTANVRCNVILKQIIQSIHFMDLQNNTKGHSGWFKYVKVTCKSNRVRLNNNTTEVVIALYKRELYNTRNHNKLIEDIKYACSFKYFFTTMWLRSQIRLVKRWWLIFYNGSSDRSSSCKVYIIRLIWLLVYVKGVWDDTLEV